MFFKSGCGARRYQCTVSVTVVECERLPLVPLMVMVNVPTDVLLLVATLKVEFTEPFAGTEAGFGEKLHVLLGGQPLDERVTLPLKPLTDVSVTV